MNHTNEAKHAGGRQTTSTVQDSVKTTMPVEETRGYGLSMGLLPFNAMAVQRTLGNRAAEQMIRRTVGSSETSSPNRWTKILTWDVKAAGGKGAFVTSAQSYKPGVYNESTNPLGYKAEDLMDDQQTPIKEFRNFSLTKAWATDKSEQMMLSKVKTLADIDKLTMEEINSIDPQSQVPYKILHDVLNQSWHDAKHELAASESPQRKALMRKLWEYRQWHHNEVLKATQAVVNAEKNDPKGLEKWPSAGSTTLTSDIDVNLKGTHTEYAVGVYNRLFKNGVPAGHNWDVESGVAYDVNVYALDFMHAGFTFGKENKPEGGGKLTGKEGVRKDLAKGGFTEQMIENRDTGDQKIWSLVKMRLYMKNTQWENYVAETKPDRDTLSQVDKRYQEYFSTLQTQMIKEAGLPLTETGAALSEAIQAEETGIAQIDKAAGELAAQQTGETLAEGTRAEQLKMGASNRIYEQKLAEIKKIRLELEEKIPRYNQLFDSKSTGGAAGYGQTEIEILKGSIEMGLRQLRRLLSEAAMFSNEAYLTDAAVNHAVVGIQSGMAVKQSKNESMIAVNENVADSLKEIARHGGGGGPEMLGEAAYKASKYYFRMADAAKNMGLGKVPGIQPLYDAGFKISVELKGGGGGNVEEQSAAVIREYFGSGVTTPDSLASKIVEVGTGVTKEFASVSDKNALGQAMPAAKNARNPNE
jgi:hypothetical protein